MLTRKLAAALLAVATALGLAAPASAADFYGPQDFDTLTVGVKPTGWANIGAANFVVTNSGAISGVNAFGEASPSGSDDVCLYTATATGDGEVYFDFAAVGTSGTDYTTIGVVFRSNSSFTSADGFYFGVTGNASFLRRTGSSYSGIGITGTWPALTNGQKYSLRARVQGATYAARIWPYGTTEPGSWTVTTSDPGSVGTAGYLGLRAGGIGSTAAVTVDNLTLADLAPPITALPFVSGSGDSVGILFEVADAPVNVHTINPSGVQPSIRINGGSPITLPPGFWGKGRPSSGPVPPYLPFYLAPLPAASPAVRRFGCGEGGFTSANFAALGGPSYSNRPFVSSVSGASTTWEVGGFVPGDTIQLAMRWATDPTLSTAARVQLIDKDFNVLATFTVDQSVPTRADYTEANGLGVSYAFQSIGSVTIAPGNRTLYVQVTSQGNKVGVDAIRLARTSPDNSLHVGPGDVVTLDYPAGWATLFYNGSPVNAPAGAGLAVANHSGGSILPPAPTSTTLKAGFNVEPIAHGTTSIVKSDLLLDRIELPLGGAASSDPNNYFPTSLSSQSVGGIPITGQPGDDGGRGQGLRYLPNGYYAVSWTGPDDYALEPGSNTFVGEVVGLRQANYRVYHCQGAPGIQVSPSFNLRLTSAAAVSGGTYAWSSSKPNIYPPDPSDPTGLTPWYVPGGARPPKFHPSYVAHLAGAKSIRFLDPLGTNNNFIRELDDVTLRNSVDVGVASIEYPGPGDPFFDPKNFSIAKITTSGPHGLFEGCIFSLSGCGTATTTSTHEPIAPGPDIALDGGFFAHVDGLPNNVLYAQVLRSGGQYAIAAPVTPASGRLRAVWSGNVPFQDYIDTCNLADGGAGADFYLNLPTCASDRCVQLMSQKQADPVAGLKPGRKVRLEYSNEVWNIGFAQFQWVNALSYRTKLARGDVGASDDTNYIPGYVQEAARLQDVFIAAWTAAGRNSSDAIRVMAGNAGNPGAYTVTIANELVAQNKSCDLFVTAPYVSNSSVFCGSEPDLADVTDGMTAPVCGDLLELIILHGGWGELSFDAHKVFFDAHPSLAGVKLGAYEFGWQVLTPWNSWVDSHRRTHQMQHDPRMFRWEQALLRQMEAHGCEVVHFFVLSGGDAFQVHLDANNAAHVAPAGWDVYTGFDQADGAGTPGENPDPDDAVNRKSEIGGAIKSWNALLSPAGPTNPAKFPRKPGHRAGSRRPD